MFQNLKMHFISERYFLIYIFIYTNLFVGIFELKFSIFRLQIQHATFNSLRSTKLNLLRIYTQVLLFLYLS